MKITFTKMNGAGNDFVVVDNRSLEITWTPARIARLCDRHRGIGADGLLAVEPGRQPGVDFTMRYFNSDGGEAEMCGNGARCFARFAADLLPEPRREIRFQTLAGPIGASLWDDGTVELAMSDPHSLTEAAALTIPTGTETRSLAVYSLNTGVPHAVLFLESPEALAVVDVAQLGRAIRYHPHFAPAGTNVNFVAALAPQLLRVRTYERGVEAETLACGTGVVASALLHHHRTGAPSPIRVEVRGGDTMEVRFSRDAGDNFREVFLRGPADKTFQGEILLPD